jgi:hypothetical protein
MRNITRNEALCEIILVLAARPGSQRLIAAMEAPAPRFAETANDLAK